MPCEEGVNRLYYKVKQFVRRTVSPYVINKRNKRKRNRLWNLLQ